MIYLFSRCILWSEPSIKTSVTLTQARNSICTDSRTCVSLSEMFRLFYDFILCNGHPVDAFSARNLWQGRCWRKSGENEISSFDSFWARVSLSCQLVLSDGNDRAHEDAKVIFMKGRDILLDGTRLLAPEQ